VSGGRFIARIGSAQTPASVRSLDKAIDIHTYEPRDANALLMNEIGRVTIAFDRPPVTVPYGESRDLGAFILIDQLSNETVALGLVREVGANAPAPEGAAEPVPVARTPLEKAKRAWLGTDVLLNPVRRKGAIRFRALAAVLIALLSALLGLHLVGALVLGIADFLLRPFVRPLVDRTERKPERVDPTTVVDGAGI
jgi:sulfate adenylyltransferase subunit 1